MHLSLISLSFVTLLTFRFAEGSSGASCPVKTDKNTCCVFPFVYKGKTYTSCAKTSSSRAWCATTPSYDKDKKWDRCQGLEAYITADDKAYVFANGRNMGNDNGRWDVAQRYILPLDVQVVAILGHNSGGRGGIMAKFSNGIVTDASWKCSNSPGANWQTTNYDDSQWPAAVVHTANGNGVSALPGNVHWIGTTNINAGYTVCRRRISVKAEAPPTGGSCNSPLGVEDGYVENNAMTASSNWDAQHMSWRARLNMVKQGSYVGSWCARHNDVNQWLQIDFTRPTRVTAVGTQGRQDYRQYVTSYALSYSVDGSRFTAYAVGGRLKVFSGNRDQNSLVKNTVSPAIEAQYVRIHPKSWYSHISMRVEFYGCNMACKVDVGILMDESGSVNGGDFVKEKNFVKDLVGHFQLGANAAQFGVITFSNNANLDIALNSYRDIRSFRNAVDRIRQAGGNTYTNKALELAYTQLFSISRGARTNTAKVLIVITDGVSTGGIQSLTAPLKRLKDASTNIISIGVGGNINRRELEAMATAPGARHVFFVNNMDQLKTLVNSISSSSCSSFSCRYVTCEYSAWAGWNKPCGPGMTRVRRLAKTNTHTKQQQGGCSGLKQTCDAQITETKTTNCVCKYVTCSWNNWGAWSATCGRMVRQRSSKVTHHTVGRQNCNGLQTKCPAPESSSIYVSCCKVELGIMMDESGSVSAPDFQREKDFVIAIANKFNNFGPNGMQMSVISFSTQAHLDIKFNQYSDKASFIRAIQGIRQARGWTYSNVALNLARTHMFSPSSGVRSKVTKILLVLTDGISTSGYNSLVTPTRLLKEGHVNIFTVGIGRNINKRELELMASDPKNSHVFYVANMQQLPTLLTAISDASCKAYDCKYVTCDYATWTAWSASCGNGMRRTRRLSKVNTHTTQQQGGCSGLKTTCEPSFTETKNMNCACRYVSCSWGAWSGWSASCGASTRRRASVPTQHVVNRPSCGGLQTSCPAPQTAKQVINCCRYVTCVWGQWGAWSGTCGRMVRQRNPTATNHIVVRPSCTGLQTKCPVPEAQVKHHSCCKADVALILDESGSVNAPDFTRMKEFVAQLAGAFDNYRADGMQMGVITFSTRPLLRIKFSDGRDQKTFINKIRAIRQNGGWTYTGKALDMARQQLFTSANGARTGVTKIALIITDGVSSSGTAKLTEALAKIKALKINIFSIGVGNRLNKAELRLMASDPKDSHMSHVNDMSQLPTLLHALSTSTCQMFTCKYVTCDYATWTAWSASCGNGMRRTRRLSKVNTHTTQQQGGCSGLKTTCEQSLIETKNMNCACRYVSCSWGTWSGWSASCGATTRRRASVPTQHVVNRPSCSGLQTSCPAPQTQSKTTYCPCVGVTCNWGAWGAWSASCGAAERIRKIQSKPTVIQSLDCSRVPKSCPPRTDKQKRSTNCNCPTVQCRWNAWSDWTASCGSATRRRTIETVKTTVQKPSCAGLPQACAQKPESESRRVLCICKTVRCDQFNAWSSWTATCGKATRTRSVRTVAVTVQRFDCNGLPKTCSVPPETQTRTTNCKCPTVKCTWNPWTQWSASCGSATRSRTIKTAKITVDKPSCAGLPQSCTQKPEGETRKELCTCKTVKCDEFNDWTAWTATCGAATRTRSVKTVAVTVKKYDCSGLPQTCSVSPETQKRTTNCKCPTVKCTWNPWTQWSASCGSATRSRTIKTAKITVDKPSCAGLPQSCTQKPQAETRKELCTCKTVKCDEFNNWTAWTATCGAATRTRSVKTVAVTVKKYDCSGLPQTCSSPPETEKRITDCACRAVKCVWEDWSEWSASCGAAARTRKIKATDIVVNQPDCNDLTQKCTQTPETEKRQTKCQCPTVQCSWNSWGAWSTSCGPATRSRTIKTTKKTVEALNCDGLPQKCTQPPQTDSRSTMCSCDTVKCVWNDWGAWSATCGRMKRTKTIKTEKIVVQKPSCDGLPQMCSQRPESESREVMCACDTVKCAWNEWEAWSATCGVATRKRTIKTTKHTVQKLNCDGLPQKCTEKPETENRQTMCTCPSVKCTWNDWTTWSKTCGAATRTRSIKTTQTTVQNVDCSTVPKTCTQKPETEKRSTMCSCKTVSCDWAAWGNWSGDCGKVKRQRKIVQSDKVVQKESCDGLPQTCTQTPEEETNTLPECQECFTVNCRYGPWAPWTATCGPATRHRYQLVDEIFVQKASCEGLPMECTGLYKQTESRSTPTCGSTPPPPATPPKPTT